MHSFEPEAIKQLFADMQDEATKFVRSCDNTAQIDLEYKIYMRYAGQGWEIPIPLEASDAADQIKAELSCRSSCKADR